MKGKDHRLVCREQFVKILIFIDGPVVGHGTPLPNVDGKLGVGTTSNWLTPALPISTEPNGMPVRATLPGNEDDVAADDEAPLLTLMPHVPGVAALPGSDVPGCTGIPPPS
jgi:hypothetical protein